jgi:hypothetical protein
MVAIDQFLEELCPFTYFTVFWTFFRSAHRYSFDIWYIALPYQDTDTECGSDPLIFHKVMALGLRKKSRIISFTHFFRSAYRYSFDI